MLTIRREQMNALSAYMLGQCEQHMAQRLRDRHPDRCRTISEPDLLGMVRRGIRKAADYGVTSEGDVQRYLEYMLLLSPDFDLRTSWASRTLRDTSLNGTQKIRQLDRHYIFALGSSVG